MTPIENKRAYRRDLTLATVMIVAGLGVTAVSLFQLNTMHGRPDDTSQLAQATPPLQSTPGAESKPAVPNSDTTTGTRPAAIPPQPAQPDADAQKAGATPALPPAPAEKTAPPIPTK
jgi:hypothetical protein